MLNGKCSCNYPLWFWMAKIPFTIRVVSHGSSHPLIFVKFVTQVKALVLFCVVKAENEALKEKVDILFKLGRSYLNNNKVKEKQTSTSNNSDGGKSDKDDTERIEVVEVTDESLEDLQTWTTHKMRGFKRVNPATDPTQPKPTPTNTSNAAKTSTKFSKESATSHSKNTSTKPPIESPPSSKSNLHPSPNSMDSTYEGKYCHYFVNYGKCNYEERSGEICKFEHKQAPMCSFGINCKRLKCMYSHPRQQKNNNFLENGRKMNQWMNPWQMLNPWMTQQQNQFQNPWNIRQGNL